ncbi:hypothetical protein CHS0354_039346 [Potamilus streckersoni]|uniref:H-type lectin domain-containing protein n=1 Tax=Potamilus streckersoni TaxID=2493646 RepID=A0AAE0T3Y6_9BIVA|nr:hypothetical protein CHS0354_039346 [Potamilus streckersoni]
MATISVKVGGSKLMVIKAVQTFLKRSMELEVINSRLWGVENKVNELFMQHDEFVSAKDKTSKQLTQIEAKSQSMKQGFGKTEKHLEKIREELENTDQMLQQLKDSLGDICNRHKSAVSSQLTRQAQLDEITTEIQTDAKIFNQREYDLKHLTKKTVEMKSVQSSAINIVGETNKDIQEHIRSRKDVQDEHSKATELETGNIQNVQQHVTTSDSCQTGIVAMDQPISSDEERLMKVQFGTPFSSPPVVSYGIMKLDTNAPSNPRIWVTLKDQSTTGFTASFTTWLGSIVYECAISWMACARS